ncbi:LysR family transcriptional regulator [Massilia endophytica]|uniref:LysR family transcriptional regulator n=1 Tax=Massilia endophytica TaxID=2899220 RepID=UPI001E41CB99|nr:LysR family transcriptional regulator [Massilia endophytica]UGQ49195.1 LysR family transcriptional regulator [Massilia endophytica]
MLRTDDLEVFVFTADHGSLSAAARALDISPALASAALRRLEEALALRLFARTTRSLRLTDEGERYLAHAREALRLLKEGHSSATRHQETLGGTLKIAMPSDAGRNLFLEWLDRFQTLHPRVAFQISISDRLADMYRQPVDIALRYGKQDDSSLIAMPVAPDNRRVLVASSAYIARHGKPETLEELKKHNCLRFMVDEATHDRWTFYPAQGGSSTIAVEGNRSADDADLVRRWAVAGQGIAYKSRLDVTADLQAGRLQVLLPDIAGEEVPLYLLCMHRMQVTPTVIALRDFLRAEVERM